MGIQGYVNRASEMQSAGHGRQGESVLPFGNEGSFIAFGRVLCMAAAECMAFRD